MGGPCDTHSGGDGGSGGGSPATGSASRAPPVRLSTTPAAAVDDARSADRTSRPAAPPCLPIVAADFSAAGGGGGEAGGPVPPTPPPPPPLRPRAGWASAPSRPHHVLDGCVAGRLLPTARCRIVCRRPDFYSLWRAATTPVRSRRTAPSQGGDAPFQRPQIPVACGYLRETAWGGGRGGGFCVEQEGMGGGGVDAEGGKTTTGRRHPGLAPRTAVAAAASAAAASAVTAATGAAARPWLSATGRRPPLLVGATGASVGRAARRGGRDGGDRRLPDWWGRGKAPPSRRRSGARGPYDEDANGALVPVLGATATAAADVDATDAVRCGWRLSHSQNSKDLSKNVSSDIRCTCRATLSLDWLTRTSTTSTSSC